ncbi:replication initiation protein [Ideonella livida]|uniref:Replication initiation protein n=1 Tax=Ideonella livida TaxID=2707176 RepID=A0A7C9PKP3_9BURK|nr:replication initiation protein [Ideonella livida]NDY93532.1 replication initiation protein [Ideonella livida]
MADPKPLHRAGPETGDPTAAPHLPGTLHKAVQALAIEPLTMALSVTGRKAYDVMIWLAQRGRPGPDGGYSSPVSAILKGFGSTTKASERVQRYIEQMVQTTVVWRPLAPSDANSLTLDGFELPGGDAPEPALQQEARTFPLLAEARLYKRAGEWWVTWYYPPSIAEQIIDPDRWAQIELNSIARLSTYTAVALYEICARYKDSPGGLTSRHEPDHWTQVLREGGGLKAREFRKFKSELLLPALRDINDKTELLVELVEHRRGAVLETVQFKVARKPAPHTARAMPVEPADVSLALRAAQWGIREVDLDPLLVRHGEDRVAEALDALAAHVESQRSGPVRKPAAYLTAILAKKQAPAAAPASAPPPAPVATQVQAAAPAPEVESLKERERQVEVWRQQRLREIREEFAHEPAERKASILNQVRQQHPLLAATPAVRRRLDAGEWESPLVSHAVLDVYATSKYGPRWKEPADLDLVMASVQAHRGR